MGVASFVIGLICLLLSPFLSVFLLLPALLALVLGIVDTAIKSKKKLPKGLSIAGIVLSAIALVVAGAITIIAVGIYSYNVNNRLDLDDIYEDSLYSSSYYSRY